MAKYIFLNSRVFAAGSQSVTDLSHAVPETLKLINKNINDEVVEQSQVVEQQPEVQEVTQPQVDIPVQETVAPSTEVPEVNMNAEVQSAVDEVVAPVQQSVAERPVENTQVLDTPTSFTEKTAEPTVSPLIEETTNAEEKKNIFSLLKTDCDKAKGTIEKIRAILTTLPEGKLKTELADYLTKLNTEIKKIEAKGLVLGEKVNQFLAQNQQEKVDNVAYSQAINNSTEVIEETPALAA